MHRSPALLAMMSVSALGPVFTRREARLGGDAKGAEDAQERGPDRTPRRDPDVTGGPTTLRLGAISHRSARAGRSARAIRSARAVRSARARTAAAPSEPARDLQTFLHWAQVPEPARQIRSARARGRRSARIRPPIPTRSGWDPAPPPRLPGRVRRRRSIRSTRPPGCRAVPPVESYAWLADDGAATSGRRRSQPGLARRARRQARPSPAHRRGRLPSGPPIACSRVPPPGRLP